MACNDIRRKIKKVFEKFTKMKSCVIMRTNSKGGINAVESILLTEEEVRKLLGAGSGDAALLFLCSKTQTPPDRAGLDGLRLKTAAAFLRQSGLWETPAPRFQQSAEPPVFSDADVARALGDSSSGFRELEQLVQRQLGKVLSNDDLRILLSMTNYLGLSNEVIPVLITYCVNRNKARGSNRTPTFRAIEQEAYRWADEGIDTLETASAFVLANATRNTRIRAVCQILGLGSRALTRSEEKYITSWLDLGFGTEEIRLAYEKTCVNTGQLKWPYMNSILQSWDAQNLHTVAQIEQFDRPAQKAGGKKSDYQQHGETLSPMMRQAVAQILSDDEED